MKRYIKIAVPALFALCSVIMSKAAEPTPKNYYDFDFIEHSNAWLTCNNAAALRLLPVKNISKATAYGTKSDGDFKNYSESDDSYQFGLNTASYYTLGKITLYGKIGYDFFSGLRMSGSVFTNPYEMPFDFVEYNENNAGKKNKETYTVDAGIGYELSRHWTVGARFNYSATNYAKRRDLRHTNTRLDWDLNFGIMYSLNKCFGVGANYIYARKVEDIKFEEIGTNEQKLFMLVSSGAFYGRWEQFSSSGFISTTTQPVFNKYHGASAQIFITKPNLKAFYEFTYKSREGYFGLKHSGYDPMYSEHDGDIFEHKIFGAILGDHSQHSATIDLQYEKLKNYETVYQQYKDESGLWVINYFGRNLTSQRENLYLTGEYRADLGIKEYMPKWSIIADGAYMQRNVTASVYPFYRDQKLKQLSANIAVNRTFFSGRNLFGVLLKGGYAKGGGIKARDGYYAEPSSATAKPQELTDLLNSEFEYISAPRINGSVGARYTRLFSKGVNGYIDLRYNFTSATKDLTYLNGKKFQALNLTIGCTF